MGKKTRMDESREPGGYISLPWSVIDSPAYQNLSYTGKALLIELARQYVRNNNGRLLLSQRYLVTRGWRSGDVILRAKRELLDAKLIYQTVQGHRPNKASWFALTWYTLDRLPGYDDSAADGFRRGMYTISPLPKPKPTREALYERWRDAGTGSPKKSTSRKILTPAHGVERAAIAPADGVEHDSVAPAHGAIRGVSGTLSTPARGDHLDIPFSVGIERLLGAVKTITPTDADNDFGQVDRIRESELDPTRFDPTTGEFCPPPKAPARQQRKSADRWVESVLVAK